jgi:endo-1,4-beta-xylanase
MKPVTRKGVKMKLHCKVLMVLAVLAVCFNTSCANKPGLGKNTPLGPLAAKRGIVLGGAVSPEQVDNSKFARLMTQNFTYLTPENHLKWGAVRPCRETFDFTASDKLVDFALKNGMAVRGHNLMWHIYNPSWLEDGNFTFEEMKATLAEHVEKVVGRYKGKIRDWDVVNEPFNENGSLRESVWYKALGPDYIAIALQMVHSADPGAKLVINDYNNETLSTKSDALYRLVKDLQARSIPVDAVGLQFHFAVENPIDYGSVARNIKRFKDLGLEVHITELDLRIRMPVTEKALLEQADAYANLLRISLALGVDEFITWGVTDSHSWVPDFYKGYGAALPFDEKYKPKPAVTAMRAVLADETPDPAYLEKLLAPPVANRTFPPFRASIAKTAPDVDGTAVPGEWDGAYVYPYAYNQLMPADQRGLTDEADLKGSWRVLYQGDMVYGMVERSDEKTIISHPNPWDNDNVEMFYSIGDEWHQIRTKVLSDWQADSRVDGKAVWSKDGRTLEFSFKIRGEALEGRTIGWSTALSDNDKSDNPARDVQVYAIPGNNMGWQGKGFGEITFQQEDGAFNDREPAGFVQPFALRNLMEKKDIPSIDGKDSDAAWLKASIYPFVYNQSNPLDQVPVSLSDCSGNWRVVSFGDTIYGLVERLDDKTVSGSTDAAFDDHIEIGFNVEGVSALLVVPVGGDFIGVPDGIRAKAKWSADGTRLEYSIKLPVKEIGAQNFRWTIGLIDSDEKGSVKSALFPFCGYNRSVTPGSADLGAQMVARGIELALMEPN